MASHIRWTFGSVQAEIANGQSRRAAARRCDERLGRAGAARLSCRPLLYEMRRPLYQPQKIALCFGGCLIAGLTAKADQIRKGSILSESDIRRTSRNRRE